MRLKKMSTPTSATPDSGANRICDSCNTQSKIGHQILRRMAEGLIGLFITVFLLTRAAAAVPVGADVAQEFKNTTYNYYFVTTQPSDKILLAASSGWVETGRYFRLYKQLSDNASAKPVRRYLFSPAVNKKAYSSHVYITRQSEIDGLAPVLAANLPPKIIDEGTQGYGLEPTIFGAELSCPVSHTPIWRAFNESRQNHRLTNDFAYYLDTILSNPSSDAGWARDPIAPVNQNDDIKICGPEAGASLALAVQVPNITAGNAVVATLTLTPAVATSGNARVQLLLPSYLSYQSDNLSVGQKCTSSTVASGTLLTCKPAIAGSATMFTATFSVATALPTTLAAIAATGILDSAETNLDPRQCTSANHPAYGCALAAVKTATSGVVDGTTKTISFSVSGGQTTNGTGRDVNLQIAPVVVATVTTYTVFAPSGISIAPSTRNNGGNCTSAAATGGTLYTCATVNPQADLLAITPSVAGEFTLWALVQSAASAASDCKSAAAAPSGCSKYVLTVSDVAATPYAIAVEAPYGNPPSGTAGQSYSWSYQCRNTSNTTDAAGVTCKTAGLPSSFVGSCDLVPATSLLRGGVMPCTITSASATATSASFSITGSATTPPASDTKIYSFSVVSTTPPVITNGPPKVTNLNVALVAGSNISGTPNTANLTYSFVSTDSATQNDVWVKLQSFDTLWRDDTSNGPANKAPLAAGATASGTFSFTTTQSSAKLRLCVVSKGTTLPQYVDCASPTSGVVGAAANDLTVTFAPPAPPAASAGVSFISQPTVLASGQVAGYGVKIEVAGATAPTLPIALSITAPTTLEIGADSSTALPAGCSLVAATGSQIINCVIAALPQTFTFKARPKAGSNTTAILLYAQAVTNVAGATSPFNCAGVLPVTACQASVALTPSAYDMAVQTFALPTASADAVLECKNIGNQATDDGNLTCTTVLTYAATDGTKATTDTYVTKIAAPLAAGQSLPIITLKAAGASTALATCSKGSSADTTACAVVANPPVDTTLTAVSVTATSGGVYESSLANNAAKVTAVPLDSDALTCVDKPVDDYFVVSGNDPDPAPRYVAFYTPNKRVFSIRLEYGPYMRTIGTKYGQPNIFLWHTGNGLPASRTIVLSPCRGDFTSSNVRLLQYPGATVAPTALMESDGTLGIWWDEPLKPFPGAPGFVVSLNSSRLVWYINIENTGCPTTGGSSCNLGWDFLKSNQ